MANNTPPPAVPAPASRMVVDHDAARMLCNHLIARRSKFWNGPELLNLARAYLAKPTLSRAGDVLSAVAELLPKQNEWTVTQIRERIDAPPKKIFNALGYLTRKKMVRRLGYGRYETISGSAAVKALSATERGGI